MTTAITNRPSAWWSPDIAPDQVETIIKAAFPAVDFIHFGEASRLWWAMVRGRMVGAADLDQLYERITAEQAGRPAPPHWSPGPDGRATPRTNASLLATRTPMPSGVSRVDMPLAPPSPYPEPGRWRRFTNRFRRLLGLPDGDDG
ncbi:hypothetical protein ACGFNU_04005 [Spirillospora sp. NPDC048911]|uniref:hypothetical protein n=1 Tax=Spirillospora sp. NPDC048911 TaxID=3364527 RepID=UPI0037168871